MEQENRERRAVIDAGGLFGAQAARHLPYSLA